MKKIFTLCSMLFLIAANALAEEVTIDFTAKGYGNNQAIETVEQDGITITFNKGTNSNAPKYYNTGTAIRCYGGNYFTVAVSGKQITSIAFTFESGEGTNAITADNGTFTSPTWSGSAESVTFTIGGTSGHRRIQKMVITIASSSDSRTVTTMELGSGYKTRFTYGQDGESITLPTASVMAEGSALSGVTVVWSVEKISGNDALVPVINGNKIDIPNHSYGKIKVTASFEGNTSYRACSTNYTIDIYKGRMNIQEIVNDFKDEVVDGGANWNAGIPTSYWQVKEVGSNLENLDATVTYVNGAYTYIQDSEGYNLLLYGYSLGYTQGDVISGDLGGGETEALYGNIKTYNGLLEMEVTGNYFETKSSGATVTPKTIEVAQLGDVYNMNAYLKIENAVYVGSPSTRNYTFKVGETEFTVRQNWTNVSVDELEENTTYTLEGMGAVYNATPQLYLISFEKSDDATAIDNVVTNEANANAPIYNVAGQQVTESYKGIVIQNGKKSIKK